MPLKEEFKQRIENYFNYRMTKDRSLAFQDNEDLYMMQQLPEEVQSMIFTKFLYVHFLQQNQEYFKIEHPNKEIGWND